MYLFLTILIMIICVFLALIVLIQNPKGGGIASNFASSNQIMGVKRTSETVEKATWVLAISLIVLTLATNFFRPSAGSTSASPEKSSVIEGELNQATPAGPGGAQPQAAPPADGQAQPPQGGDGAQPQTP